MLQDGDVDRCRLPGFHHQVKTENSTSNKLRNNADEVAVTQDRRRPKRLCCYLKDYTAFGRFVPSLLYPCVRLPVVLSVSCLIMLIKAYFVKYKNKNSQSLFLSFSFSRSDYHS